MKTLVTAFILVFAAILIVAPFATAQEGEVVTEEIATEAVLPQKTTTAEAETQIVLKEKAAEAEIPVLTKISAKPTEKSNPFFRLIVSLIIISVLCIGAIFFTKWWGRNHGTKVDSTRIRVISQHFLGPKKSLAIVRVAGESILIGITDQTISHLRTLSLLEEEAEDIEKAGEGRKDFKTALQQKSFAISNGDEEFSFGKIQDRFTSSGAKL